MGLDLFLAGLVLGLALGGGAVASIRDWRGEK
jgi:hypothetical protein